MSPTLRQIEAFLAVSGLGSFTRAAERLHLSQSAVSVLVGELERGLQVRLLDRTTRRVEVTPAGRQFAAQAAKIVSDLDHAVRHAHGFAQRLHGRLTVFAPPLLAMTVLPAAIAVHYLRHPGIAITVVDGGTEHLMTQIHAGEADLGIGTVNGDSPGVDLLPLAVDHLMLFCRASHALAQLADVPWAALPGERMIALTRHSDLRRLMDETARAAGVSLLPDYEVGQISTALAMVEAGLGVAILPGIACGVRLPGALATRALAPPVASRTIQAISRRGRALPPAASSFIAAVRDELARMPGVSPAPSDLPK